MANEKNGKINFPTPDNILKIHGDPIPNQIAKKIIQKFKKDHPASGHKPEVTWSVHFTRKDFIEMLLMMENSEADGANVYMATYTDDGRSSKPEDIGRNTVVFILTKGGKNGDLIDVDEEIDILPNNPAYNHGDLNP